MLIIGAVWTVIYNSDLLLTAIVRVFGRIGGLWQALQEQQPGNAAVVSPGLVPAKVSYNLGNSTPNFQLEGFFIEDEMLPEVYIQRRITARETRSGLESSAYSKRPLSTPPAV